MIKNFNAQQIILLRIALVTVLFIFADVRATAVFAYDAIIGNPVSESEPTDFSDDFETGLTKDISENEEAELSGKPTRHYVEWTFNTYAEPDFQAEITGSYSPQSILVYEWKEDGWALIYTYEGAYWAYLSENKKMLDVPSYNQRGLGYPTGCEIVSVAMMINYTTEVSVKTLVSEMPSSQNPNDGFRGNPATINGFTIYPQALLSLTEKYLGSAQDMSGCEIEDLKRKLHKNVPVIVWINGLGFNVHVLCLTGYDENGLYYNDPWTGKKDSFITYDSFYEIWNEPIYDNLYGNSYPTRKALSYSPYCFN